MEGLIQTPLGENVAALNGSIKADLFEAGGTTPTHIIRTDQDWYVKVEWQLNGDLVQTMAGKWHVHVIIEQMGGPGGGSPGLEISKFFTPDVPFVPDSGHLYQPSPYGFTVNEMKNWNPSVPHEGGLYRVLVTITFWNVNGSPGPLAGFVDLGLVQIFNP